MAWPEPPEKWYAGWARAVLQTLDQRLGVLDANKVGAGRNITQRFCHDGVAAAGTSQAGATQLMGDICRITTGSGGAKLPSARAGMRVTVINALTSTSSIYPFLGQRIGTSGTNAAVALAPSAKQMFESPADLIWY